MIKKIVISYLTKRMGIVIIICFALFLLSTLLYAQAPGTLWTQIWGGTNDDTGFSVQEISDGGYIIAGYTRSFGAQWYDVYLTKTDENGDTLWTKIYGGDGYDEAQAVLETTTNEYIVAGRTFSYGAGSSDVYLIKTDENGDTLWTRTYGGTLNDEAYSIQQTDDNGYIIAGHTRSFGGGAWYDVYLIRADENGDTLWTKTYGDAGNYYDGAYSVQETDDNGFIVAGWTATPLGQNYHWDAYLIKTDENGDTLWTKNYGGPDDDKGYSVQQTYDGGYIIAGHTESFGAGNRDIYLIRTDANGDTLWTRTYGGTNQDGSSSVMQTSDEGFVIAGYTKSFGAGGYDVYVVKTDENGNILWTETYGGSYWDEGQDIKQTSDNGYIIVGYASSFGAGLWDVYLIKTDPDIIKIDDEQTIQSDIFVSSCHPNPFNLTTTISFNISRKDEKDAKIVIYNIKGQKVKTLENLESASPSPFFADGVGYSISWNGTDENGKPVSSGIYFYQLCLHPDLSGKAGNVFSETKRMLLLK